MDFMDWMLYVLKNKTIVRKILCLLSFPLTYLLSYCRRSNQVTGMMMSDQTKVEFRRWWRISMEPIIRRTLMILHSVEYLWKAYVFAKLLVVYTVRLNKVMEHSIIPLNDFITCDLWNNWSVIFWIPSGSCDRSWTLLVYGKELWPVTCFNSIFPDNCFPKTHYTCIKRSFANLRLYPNTWFPSEYLFWFK